MARTRISSNPSVVPAPYGTFDPALADSTKRRTLSGPALRTFLAIAAEWGLDEAARLRVLGLPSRSTYYTWVEKARANRPLTLDLDVLLRISAVLGIYKALRILFARPQDAQVWLASPNRGLVFGGQRPIDLVTSGTQDAILQVRRHLDAWRGGLFASPNEADRDSQPLTDADIVFA